MHGQSFPRKKKKKTKRNRIILSRIPQSKFPSLPLAMHGQNFPREKKKDVKKRRIPGGAFGTLTKLS